MKTKKKVVGNYIGTVMGFVWKQIVKRYHRIEPKLLVLLRGYIILSSQHLLLRLYTMLSSNNIAVHPFY